MVRKIAPVGRGAGVYAEPKADDDDAPRRRVVLTDEQIKDAVKIYGDGVPIRIVAEEFGVSYGKMHSTLKAAGVQMRARSGK